jgi:flagellar hook-basal body complex protein FliE
MTTPLIASNAYAGLASLARVADPTGGIAKTVKDSVGDPAGSDFGTMVKDAISAIDEIGRKSDAQTQAAATGKGNMIDVVTAVAESEVAIETLVSVRDRVIQAYEEIMRMPI